MFKMHCRTHETKQETGQLSANLPWHDAHRLGRLFPLQYLHNVKKEGGLQIFYDYR
jgi:hypothetical protein